MDLVGLVIAGQRVHHEIDAAAQRQFALPRAAGNQRIERPAVGVLRPGAGEIVGGDDDRRNAVAGARRALTWSFGSGGGSASTQVWPIAVRPTKRSSR